ncbi:MAG: hypothetical protein VBE63_11135 [Lamprobacter sp.]|uniref:hypothetical protein n=1 Tax=Lamprobacter sp. TaxID=3100796 RepID=UPI002B259AA9|nr:hypothetical protein [Lamprobacter sp.]MEA3640485.1 hypothetical protein [Lamprobacter sp.]
MADILLSPVVLGELEFGVEKSALDSPLNRSSSMDGLPEADQSSAGGRLPAAALTVLHAGAEP